uniref:DUF5710 domain-containing protein n=1 Tax=unclassified Variovorax TaxID=663243 RepID=UPI000DA24136
MSRQYLDVPYRSKDAAKALGARFDGTVKRWYVEAGVDLVAFSAWLPASAEEQMASAAEKTKRARHLRKEKEKRARGEMHRAGPAPKPSASPRAPGGLQPRTPEQKAALLSRLPPAV